jgi:DNA-binding IclR family transcriptional regulator
MSGTAINSRQGGSQTLARGLTALMTIAESTEGVTVQDLAVLLNVHRSIAYRLVQTLVDFGLVVPSSERTYRPGPRLAALSDSFHPTLREIAQPYMRGLADEAGSTVSLFIADGASAVAIATVEPTTVEHHLRFRPGMRTPISQGAAGYALLAIAPARHDDLAAVVQARRDGFAVSHGEVMQGAHAVAAGFSGPGVRASVAVLTYIEEQAWAARELVRRCASSIERVIVDLAGPDVPA